MAEKYFSGKIPDFVDASCDALAKDNVLPKIEALPDSVDESLGRLDFISALSSIWELVGICNKYIEETKPWALKKENKIREIENFIAVLIKAIRVVALELTPFMPATAAKIMSQIKSDRVEKGEPLFPRIIPV